MFLGNLSAILSVVDTWATEGVRSPPTLAGTKIFFSKTVEVNAAFTETIASPPLFG